MSKADEIVRAIADDLISFAGGDTRKARVLAALYLTDDKFPVTPEDHLQEIYGPFPVGFGTHAPRFGATDYSEDWS
jgi:hypothetical protein